MHFAAPSVEGSPESKSQSPFPCVCLYEIPQTIKVSDSGFRRIKVSQAAALPKGLRKTFPDDLVGMCCKLEISTSEKW